MSGLRWLVPAAAVLAVASLAAACGNDDDDDATPTLPASEVEVTLFFPRNTATGFEFIPAVRTVAAGTAGPQSLVALLLAGPTAEEESSLAVNNPFPADVEVLSLEVAGGKATVDFSAQLLDYGGGSANVLAITGCISRTIQEATGASVVVILVEGEPDQLQP